MPDRYDPKLSVRPPGERRSSSAPAEDDPLVELARLVTGRSPFDPGAQAKGRAAPAAPARAPDPETDLETELLSDLQASFNAIREQVAAPPAAPARTAQPAPAPAPARPAPAAPAPATAATRPAPPAPAAPRPAQPRAAPPPPPPAAELDEDELPPFRPAAEERPVERPAERVVRTEPPARAEPAARAPTPPRATPPQPRVDEPLAVRATDTPSMFRPSRIAVRGDLGGAVLRPTTAPVNPPRPAAGEATVRPPLGSRWAKPETPRVAAAPEPPRPPAARAPVRPAPAEPDYEGYEGEEALYEEPAYADDAPVAPDVAYEDDLVLEDPDLPGFGQEDELPPFPEDELAEAGRRRSRRTIVVVAVLLLAVLGGGGYYLWTSGTLNTAPPPIIAADATPTKVPPAETPPADDADSQAKLIYDRVDDGNANETLVTPGEDPIADIPAIPEEDAGNPISRVIIPGGPGIDAPAGDAAAATADPADPAVIADAADPTADAAADSAAAPIGPRKVRTVVVKPDGTIVSSEAAPADGIGDGAAPAADEAAAAPPSDEFPIPPARTDMDSVLEGDSVAVNTDPLGATAPPAAPGTVPAADAAPLPPSEDFPDPTVAEAPAPAPAPAPEPPKPAAPPKPAVVATTGDASGPIDLTPSAPSRPAATGGGTLVQVSSQKSEDAARSTFRDLQRRYPGILGSYEPDIQRADLGDRGVYFRVRVGPFSGADAQRLCDNLKAAGGDCIIAR